VERQTEVEVFLRDCARDRLVAWLASVVGPLGEPEAAGDATVYPSAAGPVVVTPGVGGGAFVGVWFNTPRTPWATDADCGRQAARELECAVRCSPGRRFPEAPEWVSDVFLEISGPVEKLVRWEEG
jgi:hypothetical protein